jgi:ParB/RepB/Spo0J family partition protein
MSNGRPRIHLPPRDISGIDYKLESVLLSEILFDSDFNCRGEFTYESVANLAETIADAGLLYPIILWPREGLPDGKKFQLVAGHRRYRAFELLKQTRIPAIIRPDLDQRRAEIINLTENLERKDLNVLQEARALKKRYPDGGSLRAISKELKQSERWIQDRFHLLKFPLDVQEMLGAGRIPIGYIAKLYKAFNEKGAAGCIEAAKAIEAARTEKGVVNRNLPENLRHTKYPKPTQQEVIELMTMMFDSTIVGLTPKYAAYREGWISKEEIIKEIKKRVPKWAVRAVEQTDLPD